MNHYRKRSQEKPDLGKVNGRSKGCHGRASRGGPGPQCGNRAHGCIRMWAKKGPDCPQTRARGLCPEPHTLQEPCLALQSPSIHGVKPLRVKQTPLSSSLLQVLTWLSVAKQHQHPLDGGEKCRLPSLPSDHSMLTRVCSLTRSPGGLLAP